MINRFPHPNPLAENRSEVLHVLKDGLIIIFKHYNFCIQKEENIIFTKSDLGDEYADDEEEIDNYHEDYENVEDDDYEEY